MEGIKRKECDYRTQHDETCFALMAMGDWTHPGYGVCMNHFRRSKLQRLEIRNMSQLPQGAALRVPLVPMAASAA